ncbi:hypothetical protein HDF16_000129 [Granulicella aggregans]|uniref:Uncharacterized protein n=1 Tax=Granulicella aggregans TaxID=474949 RepID=A0A7W8E2T3_9BACT|nr:hypothetical protein [Granulicella aggregans]MBB5055460.1 hypothetical protein [Granulicella aggregans]
MPANAENIPEVQEPSEAALEDNNIVDVGILQLRLPCRAFQIAYKVAETGELSLTTEFLLRLLRLADGLPETSISEFFGFTPDETQFVVDYVEGKGYTQRRNGRVSLTSGGRSLFVGSEEPALFEVTPKLERFDFDLVSYTPADTWNRLGEFENKLPELSIASHSAGENTSEHVLRAFKRYFQIFLQRKGGPKLDRRKLYTVDAVHADLRFSVLVPVTLSVRIDEPSFLEADLLSWKTGAELDDRGSVVESCVKFAKEITFRSDQISSASVDALQECAPLQMSGFVKGHVFDSGAFFRATMQQVGAFRIDRPTLRVVGQVWTNANRARLASALHYAKVQERTLPELLIWLKPATPYWGATTRLQDTIEAVNRTFMREGEDTNRTLRSVVIGTEDKRAANALKHVFGSVLHTRPQDLPGGLELLIVPGVLAYMAVHGPLGQKEGFPIPLGVMTFDLEAVKRAQIELSKILATAHSTQFYCDWLSDDVMSEVHNVLLGSPRIQSTI